MNHVSDTYRIVRQGKCGEPTLHKLLENELRRGECLGTVTINKSLDLMRKIRGGVFADGARIAYEIPLKVRKLLENIAPDLLESITGKEPAAKKSVVTSNE